MNTFQEALSRHSDLSQSERVFAVVAEFPFRTAAELQSKIGEEIIDGEAFHKRLPELRKRGKVINGELRRRCTVTHRLAQTWAPNNRMEA